MCCLLGVARPDVCNRAIKWNDALPGGSKVL